MFYARLQRAKLQIVHAGFNECVNPLFQKIKEREFVTRARFPSDVEQRDGNGRRRRCKMRDDFLVTDHVTESIAFYLRLRTDENVVAFSQLSQTVRYVLKVIGYKEIVPHFAPSPPPISISLLDIAYEAGMGYELAFFDLLEKRINTLVETGVDDLQLCSLQSCVKHLRGVKAWTRACDALREEIVCFVREKLITNGSVTLLNCSLR